MNARPPIRRILNSLRNSRTTCIVGHSRPDGDCIGSQLALAMALLPLGHTVHCWNQDPVPDKLAFLDPHHLLHKPQPGLTFDCVIALDSASTERLGQTANCIQHRRCLINIDHHSGNTLFGDLNWISPLHPSTGELIYQLLSVASWPITPPIANCLFTAISTDTGSFQYPSTRPDTLHVAGHLVELGADLATVSNEVYQSCSLSRIRLLRHLYDNFRLASGNRIAYLWLKKTDYQRTGANSGDTEGLIDHIRAIEPVVVACIFEEIEPRLTRFSLRSKSQAINVSEIAQQFGGGGHPAAAGARVAGPPLSVQRRVLNALRRALRSLH